jgi:hypothetical protein
MNIYDQLDGQAALTKFDVSDGSSTVRATIDEIARRINEVARGAALDFAYAVGEVVIKELYRGDVALWGREGTRSPSYQRLASRSDLVLSPSALCRAVGVYALCERHGGRDSWPHLSVSHLQEVLALEPPQQERLLGIANSERWTVSRLRSESSKQRPQKRPGRPRSLIKTVRDLKTFFAQRRDSLFDPRGVSRLNGSSAAELREILSVLRRDLDQLEKLLPAAAGHPTSKS